MNTFKLTSGKTIKVTFRHGIHEKKIHVSNGDVTGIKTVRTPMTSCEMTLEIPGEKSLTSVGLTQKNPKDSYDYLFARQVATLYALLNFELNKGDWGLFWNQYQKTFRCDPPKFWGWVKSLTKNDILEAIK